jgi:hypothetical protein
MGKTNRKQERKKKKGTKKKGERMNLQSTLLGSVSFQMVLNQCFV